MRRTLRPPARCLAIGMMTALVSGVLAGCALHYTDPRTGVEHLWGIGHMTMRMDTDGRSQAVARAVDTVGISMGRADGDSYVTVGWHRRERVDVTDDGVVCLSSPTGSLMNVRIGAAWRDHMLDPTSHTRGCR